MSRATIYKGIKMRSRLEADFAREMDRRRIRWAYEPQCFADEAGQYLPDFAFYNEVGMQAHRYVDIKPLSFGESDDEVAELRRRMEIIWSTDPTAGLHIICWRWGGDRPVKSWLTFGSGLGWQAWVPNVGIVEVV